MEGSDSDDDGRSYATFSSDEEDVNHGHVNFEENFLDYETGDTHAMADIARSDPYIQKMRFCPYDPSPSPNEWITLGHNIGKNTALKKLIICTDELEDDDAIASKENLEAFCTGFSQNRSLFSLVFEYFNFQRARVETLCQFLIENDNLCRFELSDCSIGGGGVQILSNAFRQRRNPSSMKYIRLSNDSISDDSVRDIIELAHACPQLKKLDLNYNMIGNRGCRELASLLRNPESNLKCLCVDGNPIGDEEACFFANAMANNDRFKFLLIAGPGARLNITLSGWDGFLRILRGTSISGTYQSNHTLQRLVRSGIHEHMYLPEDLLVSLQANTELNKATSARIKIFHFHLNGDFDLSPFLCMDATVLPDVLGWIGKDYNETDGDNRLSRVSAFCRILVNVPGLCNFPSRTTKKICQLEAELDALRADNAEQQQKNEESKARMVELSEENSKLKEEIKALKSNKRKNCEA